MDIDFAALLAAFGGGVFGAAIGTLPVFILTGFAVLAGAAAVAGGGGGAVLSQVAFGPFLGPHIAFGGGAAATAYAFKKGLLDSGRDITPGLMGLNRPDVLVVGGVFGALGYLIERGWQALGLVAWTDTIALTVVVSAVIARVAFGSKGVFGTPHPKGKRFQTDDVSNWLPWQESPAMLVMAGLGAGLPSAYAASLLGAGAGGDVIGFGIAAASLAFLQFGVKTPVTHHIALPAAIATIASGSLVVGGLFGVVGAFAGELWSRVFLIHGDTHIDPPAAAIASTVVVIRALEAVGAF